MSISYILETGIFEMTPPAIRSSAVNEITNMIHGAGDGLPKGAGIPGKGR